MFWHPRNLAILGGLRAGLALNDNGGFLISRRNRPLYAISEQTFLWQARENLPEKVLLHFRI